MSAPASDPLANVEASSLRISAATNLERDEALLRHGRPGCRSAELHGVALSVGVGVQGAPAYVRRALAGGMPVLRRPTGGTGVLHLAGDLVWSVVRSRADPVVGRDYVRAYGRLGSGVVDFLRSHGVESRWEAAPIVAADLCVLSGLGQVLTVGSRILGGAAQHATADALLHHGMIARSVDRPTLAGLFELPPTVFDRLTSLDELGVRGSDGALVRDLARSLSASFA